MSQAPIIITKGAPSDEEAKTVLKEWFLISTPKWLFPAMICAGGFFVASTVFFMMQSPPPFAWIALAGAVITFIIIAVYVPLFTSTALKAGKKSPSYFQPKTYAFYTRHLVYTPQDAPGVEIPYETFSKVHITKNAILFLIGEKLALWITMNNMDLASLARILTSLEDCDVKVMLDSGEKKNRTDKS